MKAWVLILVLYTSGGYQHIDLSGRLTWDECWTRAEFLNNNNTNPRTRYTCDNVGVQK